MMNTQMLAWGMPQGPEWLIIALIALLIWGKRLPEVGRSLGKGITEFKKGLSGIGEENEPVDKAGSIPMVQNPATPEQIGQQPQAQQFKFDPYTGKPIETSAAVSAGQESPKV